MSVDEGRSSAELTVRDWQVHQLLRLGYGPGEAVELAEQGADYHELERFLAAHPACPLALAKEILR